MTAYPRFTKTYAAAALMTSLTLGACSASGDVDTSGDGISVEGDVDTPINDTTEAP